MHRIGQRLTSAAMVALMLASGLPPAAALAAGPADHLSFTIGPTNTVAGSTITTVTVEVQDLSNAVVTTDSSTQVSLAIGATPAGGTLTGGGAVTVASGVATFAGLSIDNVGTGYTLVASATGLPDATSAPFDVTAIAQAITFGALGGRTYGDLPFTVSASGGASGNPVTFSSTTPLVCSATGTDGATVTILAAGTCTIDADQAGGGNYAAAPTVSQGFTVDPKNLTVTGITADNKPYDGLLTATIHTGLAALAGVLLGDVANVTLDVSGASGAFLTATAGAGKTVQIAGLAITGSAIGNYALTQPTTTADITAIAQAITFGALGGRTYGDLPFTVSASGGASGNPVTFSSTTPLVCSATGTDGATVTILAAGTCTIDADQAGGGNYAAAPTVSQGFTVATASPGISVTGGGFTYTGSPHAGSGFAYGVGGIGDVLAPAVTLTYAGTGGTTYGPTTTAPTAAGTYSVTADFAGNANYDPSSASAALTIGQASQAITFGALGGRTYGDLPFTVSASGGASGNPVTFSSTTPLVCSATGTDGATVTILAAGTCTIDADQAGGGNYAAAPTVSQWFTVATASPGISVTGGGFTYTGSPHAGSGFAYGVGGIGDVLAPAVTLTYAGTGGTTYGPTTTAPTAAGTYSVTADFAGNANYDPSSASAALTIGQASQAITFGALGGRTYGDLPFTVSASGGASGNPVTFSSTTPLVCSATGTDGATVTILAAGTCTIDADQAGGGNYAAAPTVSQSFTVAKADLTVTFTADNRQWDGTRTATIASCALVGVVGIDDVTCDSSSATALFDTSAVGAGKTVTGTGFALAGTARSSYQIAAVDTTTANITGNVAQTITFGALGDKTYGDATFDVSATSDSGLTVTFTSATTGACTVSGATVTILAAGTCTIHADQAGDDTYAAASTVPRSFTVAKATLAVSADNQLITYGSSDPAFTFTYGTFVGSDNGTVIDTPPTCSVAGPHANVSGSPYTITCSGGVDNNYGFSYTDGSLTVAKATPTIGLLGSVTTYETNVPVTFTATLPAVGAGSAPTGSVTFKVTGFADAIQPLAAGVATDPVTFPTTGAKSVQVDFAGDGNYLAASASIAPTVVANTVKVTGVGLSATSFYPVVDGWRDTVLVRGTRLEPISVAISIYNPAGARIRVLAVGRASGAYAVAWNGRNSSGVILPAARYRVTQTLTDAFGARAVVTSYVTTSLRRMYWRTVILSAQPGPRCWLFWSGSGTTTGARCTAGSLVVRGSAGKWPLVGYQFTVPAATAYRSFAFQVRGSRSGARTPRLGLLDWTYTAYGPASAASWKPVYDARVTTVPVIPSTTIWRGITRWDTSRLVRSRIVRGFVTSGGYLTSSYALSLTGVRLVVVYGILR